MKKHYSAIVEPDAEEDRLQRSDEERDPDADPDSSTVPVPSFQVATLSSICEKVLHRGLGYTNVLDLLYVFRMIECPASQTFEDRCTRFIADTYPMLRERIGLEQLTTVLGKQMVDQLEASSAESKRAIAAVKIVGKVVDKPTVQEQPKQEPSVGGHPHSYPYSMLVTGVQWPDDVEPTRREQFLAPWEFQQVFGMSYEAYCKVPQWKKLDLRKRHNLF